MTCCAPKPKRPPQWVSRALRLVGAKHGTHFPRFQTAIPYYPFAMPQSLSRVHLHIIFSAKNRQPLISPEILPELHRYLGGVASQNECPAVTVGGVADHVHLLCELSRTKTISDLLAELKRSSSLWIKQRFPVAAEFAWQRGYGAFSVAHSQLDQVRRYIANQPAHHRTTTFQDDSAHSSKNTKSRTTKNTFGIKCRFHFPSPLPEPASGHRLRTHPPEGHRRLILSIRHPYQSHQIRHGRFPLQRRDEFDCATPHAPRQVRARRATPFPIQSLGLRE
jgi:putative transposase